MRSALGAAFAALLVVCACQRGSASDGRRPVGAAAVEGPATGTTSAAPTDSAGATPIVSSSASPRPSSSLVSPRPSSSLASNPKGSRPATTGREASCFAVIGDFGDGSSAEASVARLVKSWQPDFVITTGDDNYPSGQATTIDEHIGAFYSEFIGSYVGAFGRGSTVNRFWPTPGNHDWLTSGLSPYLEYFTLPGKERYYDVETALVHLVALDSDPKEPDGTSPSSVQGNWARERMAASTACFQVVYFHHPPYSSGPHGDTANMQWPFRAWGAVAVLGGHDHTYERFDIEGTPYIVNGLGGADRYPFRGSAHARSQLRYSEKHGAMRVVADRNGIAFEFWNVDGKKIDDVRIPKHCPGGSGPTTPPLAP